ncbi:MAG: hypothetical protein IIY58_03555 [Aeriscardovia sp.]|nr:hypothetical protein [Aeriscardovia sp.]
MPYKSRNWEKMRIAKSPGCKREMQVLESEDFKNCVLPPKWAITDEIVEAASYGPPRVGSIIIYAKEPIAGFEARKRAWEENLRVLWAATGYALRPEPHIASRGELKRNQAWDAYIGAYNAATAAHKYAGKAYIVLSWDADILDIGKDPEVIAQLLDPNPAADRVRLARI